MYHRAWTMPACCSDSSDSGQPGVFVFPQTAQQAETHQQEHKGEGQTCCDDACLQCTQTASKQQHRRHDTLGYGQKMRWIVGGLG